MGLRAAEADLYKQPCPPPQMKHSALPSVRAAEVVVLAVVFPLVVEVAATLGSTEVQCRLLSPVVEVVEVPLPGA